MARIRNRSASGKTCSTGCGRRLEARGLCPAHYKRWRLTGEVGPVELLRNNNAPETCTEPGCPDPHVAKGLCQRHYMRVRTTGETGPAGLLRRRYDGDKCGQAACELHAAKNGYCLYHYDLILRTGNVDYVANFTVDSSKTDGCRIFRCNTKECGFTGICEHHLDEIIKDPYTNIQGYECRKIGGVEVKIHRLVMERSIGRRLLPNENIHHRNGVRNDNRIENLEIWVTKQPPGQRPADLAKYAHEILLKYGDEKSIANLLGEVRGRKKTAK